MKKPDAELLETSEVRNTKFDFEYVVTKQLERTAFAGTYVFEAGYSKQSLITFLTALQTLHTLLIVYQDDKFQAWIKRNDKVLQGYYDGAEKRPQRPIINQQLQLYFRELVRIIGRNVLGKERELVFE